MSMLEPFISTVVVCTMSALVILTTGSWHRKVLHTFDEADTSVLAGTFDDTNPTHRAALRAHLTGEKPLPLFTGDLTIEAGRITTPQVTVLNSGTVATDVQVIGSYGTPFSGIQPVGKGKMDWFDRPHYRSEKPVDKNDDHFPLVIRGKSRLHSSALALYSFADSPLGKWGAYLMGICLLLFAFTTVITWYYFSDRCLVYLGWKKLLAPYKLLFVLFFAMGCWMDTSVVWSMQEVAAALTAFPNLFGLLYLRKEIKQALQKK